MIFTKKYIRQIIAEEIKNAIEMKKNLQKKETKLEKLRNKVLKVFIKYRQIVTSMSSTKKDARISLEKELENIKQKFGLKMEYPKFVVLCVNILNGKADPQLVTFIKTLIRMDRRFKPYLDKLDTYNASISPEEEKYQPALRKDPDPGFMRVPKTDNAIDDQEDLRRDKKTLTQS